MLQGSLATAPFVAYTVSSCASAGGEECHLTIINIIITIMVIIIIIITVTIIITLVLKA